MQALFELPAQEYQKRQIKLIRCPVTCFLCRIFDKKKAPRDDELCQFWVSWPNCKISLAAIFGFFFRMKASSA